MVKKESTEELGEQQEAEPTSKEEWTAQEIPTETKPMVVNTKDGKAYTTEIILALILNKLESIEKLLK